MTLVGGQVGRLEGILLAALYPALLGLVWVREPRLTGTGVPLSVPSYEANSTTPGRRMDSGATRTMGFLDASRGLSLSEWPDLRKKGETSMTSEPMRDPLTDPLLTPTNSALVIIDYQPSQIQTVTSMDSELLVRNIVSVARTAKTYGLPIVLSTVNVANGQGHTIPELAEVLADHVEIDRTQINAWKMSSSARRSKRPGATS
jgi:ribosomal protein L18E